MAPRRLGEGPRLAFSFGAKTTKAAAAKAEKPKKANIFGFEPEEEENYFEESPAKKARVEAPEAAAAQTVVGAPELNKRKEERTTINDKGEEVTEVVWVDKAGHPCSPPPKGPPPGAKPPQALPEKPAAAAPFPKRTPPRKTPPKRTPSSAEKKPPSG